MNASKSLEALKPTRKNALKKTGKGIEGLDLPTMRDKARDVMASCPVSYVKTAVLKGEDGSVPCADTWFWVDHAEPLAALEILQRKGVAWPLGTLSEGHEFLLLVRVER